ncbi:MAG: winged helix-turn-helix domain-containing protein [Rhodanobacter sp.]
MNNVPLPATGWLTFDAVRIDVDGHRLLVDGVEVTIERKAFSVLLLLAQSPGRVFTRDEILDAVWGHSHVTPGVLNRIVTLLRHALGESATSKRYLSTVHGVGYRLDAPVRRDEGPNVVAASTEAAPGLPEASMVPVEPNLAHPDPVPIKAAARWRGWAIALGVVALAALLSLAYRSGRQPAATVAAAHSQSTKAVVVTPATSRSLIVLPLQVIGGTAQDATFAAGLGEELISLLAQVEGLHVIARTSAALAQDSGKSLPELARLLGVTHALEGSVRHDGDTVRVSLRLVDIATGQTLWAQQYDHAANDPLALERSVAQSVAASLALKLGRDVQRYLEDTGDPELYRRYLEARRLVATGPGNAWKAVAAFRRLVADAPDYGRAHAGLAIALSPPSFASPTIARKVLAEASAEATRALQLNPDLADAHAVLADAACRAADWETCITMGARAVGLAPADVAYRLMHSAHLMRLGYADQALTQMRIAYASDPLAAATRFQLARMLDALGRHDEALPLHNAMKDYPGDTHNRWFNAVWRGDLVQARQLITPDPRWHDSYAAVTAALANPALWPAARKAIAASEQPGNVFNWTRILDPQPDVQRDIAGLEDTWRSGYTGFGEMLWSPQLANHRRGPAFQDYLHRTHIIDYWNVHGWPPQCHPDGDLAVCE